MAEKCLHQQIKDIISDPKMKCGSEDLLSSLSQIAIIDHSGY